MILKKENKNRYNKETHLCSNKIFLIFSCICLLFFSCASKKQTVENINEEIEAPKDITFFDLIGINYYENKPDEKSFFPKGELFLVLKNCQAENGTKVVKILESTLPIVNIELSSENIVYSGNLFEVYTFLPGGGTYYRFTFDNSKLFVYSLDLPEGDAAEKEYNLFTCYDLENINKLQSDKIEIYK